ncbi:hypothetical protein BH23GEM6_BH23GEM6_23780 [soil metagenome]
MKSISAPTRHRRWLFTSVLTLVAVACVGVSSEQFDDDDLTLLPVDTTVQRSMDAERPERVDGFLTIEGMREPMTFVLFRSPGGFPLPFETYLPEDVAADQGGLISSGEGDAVRFSGAWEGTDAERAVLSVTIPSGELNARAAQQLVREVAEAMGPSERVTGGGYTWALEEHRFRTVGMAGRVALGRHDGTYFYLITAHPPEMGDGFGPRVHRILGEWRWANGSRLGS